MVDLGIWGVDVVGDGVFVLFGYGFVGFVSAVAECGSGGPCLVGQLHWSE